MYVCVCVRVRVCACVCVCVCARHQVSRGQGPVGEASWAQEMWTQEPRCPGPGGHLWLSLITTPRPYLHQICVVYV